MRIVQMWATRYAGAIIPIGINVIGRGGGRGRGVLVVGGVFFIIIIKFSSVTLR